MANLIDTINPGVPKALVDITTLGRTVRKRAADVLGYLERPGAPATDRPRRSAAGSSTCADPRTRIPNLINYIARSLLETGAFRPQLHPWS